MPKLKLKILLLVALLPGHLITFSQPGNPDELYSLRYSDFVVPPVKAVQEQQALIESQQTQIDALLKRIEALEKK
jgi:hypothetical protein